MFNFDDEDRENPVGSLFRYHRLQKKLDLDKVSEDLRIRQDYLEAIEQGRFDLLPGGIYRRSFVKAYAEYLKLDSSHVLAMLDELEKAPVKPGEEHLPPVKPLEPGVAEEPGAAEEKPLTTTHPRRTPRAAGKEIGYPVSIFLGLLIGGLCVIFLFQVGVEKPQRLQVGLVPAQAESLVVIPEPPDTMQLFRELLQREIGSAPELILRVEAQGRSWIQIFSDGAELYAGFINENMNAEFKAKNELSINIGVNQGIKAFLNGFELVPLEKGATRIDRENFSELIPTDRANEIVRAWEWRPEDEAGSGD
jgi:hypothetical protein